QKRGPRRIRTWPLGGQIHVPARAGDPPVCEGRGQRRRTQHRLLGTGPELRRPGPPYPADAIVVCDAAYHARDRRHQVNVPVRVPGERTMTPGASQSSLCADLGGEIRRSNSSGEEAPRELREAPEVALSVTEAGHARGIAHRLAADKVEVQSDLEVGFHS